MRNSHHNMKEKYTAVRSYADMKGLFPKSWRGKDIQGTDDVVSVRKRIWNSFRSKFGHLFTDVDITLNGGADGTDNGTIYRVRLHLPTEPRPIGPRASSKVQPNPKYPTYAGFRERIEKERKSGRKLTCSGDYRAWTREADFPDDLPLDPAQYYMHNE